MATDLFREINNAVLDLQASQMQSFERPLKRLALLLKDSQLEAHNQRLTEGVDLDKFLADGEKTGGSFVGSHRLDWPEDREKALGLTLLLIERFGEDPRAAVDFSHRYCNSSRKWIDGIHSLTGQIIIPFVRDYKAIFESRPARNRVVTSASESKKVFIVHGHDEGARETVARFIERIGLEPIILHEQASQGRTVIEKVEAHANVGFAVVLLTPDDTGCVRGGAPEPRARQNVLLELGYFLGRLGRERVCALKRGELEVPSDFAGVVWVTMDEGGGWRQTLARELQAVGYSFDWNVVMR